jgi:hypothetical protein
MAINEADFADPISRRLARGEAVSPKAQIWLDPKGQETVSPRSGGIEDPVRYDIPEDTMLYRFASVSDGAEGTMRGGWWLERHELDQLINFARSNDRSLGYAVRLLCCVPPEWGSALNFLVAAKAAGVIAAWRGYAASASATYTPPPGAPRFSGGVTYIPAQNHTAARRVPQLYIPGTRNEGASRRLFRFQGQWQTEGARDWIYGSGS